MREIHVSTIADAVRDLCIETNCCIGDDVMQAIHAALAVEKLRWAKKF